MPTRRDLLKAAPAALLPAALARASAQAPPAPPTAGMTVRMREPQNLEAPFSELKTWVTPTEQFYVRNHFAVPKLDPATHTLSIEGAVTRPIGLTLADLRRIPSVSVPLTLECAGNGRVFLAPQARGLQWGQGAVGNAEWAGVQLSELLKLAGVSPKAREVILVGADQGVVADPPSPGPIFYDRSIDIAHALNPLTLVAYRMNGQDLTPAHGAPFRAVVGGYYGMASVKWLQRIIVTERPYHGYWQTIDYAVFERDAQRGGQPSLTPITVMQPKASIARPALAEVLPRGKPYTVTGFAWGHHPIVKVEFSADAGKTWAVGTLAGPEARFAWRQWSHTWNVPDFPGPIQLAARATDATGQTQPAQRDLDRRSYMINHIVPVDIMLR